MSSSSTLGLKESELSGIMGRAALVNGFMATAAGVLSNQLVGSTHNFQTPFIASAALLMLAWSMIKGSWGENYGSTGGEADLFQIARLRVAWRIVKQGAWHRPALLLSLETHSTLLRHLPLDSCFDPDML